MLPYYTVPLNLKWDNSFHIPPWVPVWDQEFTQVAGTCPTGCCMAAPPASRLTPGTWGLLPDHSVHGSCQVLVANSEGNTAWHFLQQFPTHPRTWGWLNLLHGASIGSTQPSQIRQSYTPIFPPFLWETSMPLWPCLFHVRSQVGEGKGVGEKASTHMMLQLPPCVWHSNHPTHNGSLGRDPTQSQLSWLPPIFSTECRKKRKRKECTNSLISFSSSPWDVSATLPTWLLMGVTFPSVKVILPSPKAYLLNRFFCVCVKIITWM